MADLLLDPLPTEWAGRAIRWDFRPMVWLSNQYLRGRADTDPESLSLDQHPVTLSEHNAEFLARFQHDRER